MHLNIAQSLPLLVGLCSLALASKSESQTCYTQLDTTSVATVKTQTTTVHQTVTKTVIRNHHPHTTVTPDATTQTIVDYETSTETDHEPQATDTAYETTTENYLTTTTLDVVTETSTESDTSTTTSTSTSTVAAGPSFTPVLDTLPGAQGSNVSKKRRGLEHVGSLAARKALKKPSQPVPGKKYPTKVMCVDYVFKTKTARTTRSRPGTVTNTAPTPTSTEHSTSTVTETTTIYPDHASTTITETTSITSTATESPTTTTTTTEVETETDVIPGPTVLAACVQPDSRNIAGAINGQGIGSEGYYGGGSFKYVSASGTSDCCTQCHNTGNSCGGSAYYKAGAYCVLNILASGNYGATQLAVGSSSYSPDAGYIISNGPINGFTQNHY